MGFARVLAVLGLCALFGCATEKVTSSPPTTLNVPLLRASEVPVCAAAGPTATGEATVTVVADGTSVAVTVTYSGLSGDATAAHVHWGASGVAGPVVLPFSGSLVSPFSKTFTAADYVAAAGAPPDFAAFLVALKAGGTTYVNVHTAACKPGEIRGEFQ
jgi:hypothetical protein